MLRQTVIYFILLMMPRLLISASSAIYITDVSKYPLIEANIYFLDDTGNPIYDISESDIIISENGTPQLIEDFSCSQGSAPIDISSILSVDVSASMTHEKLSKAKSALQQWISNLPLNSEAAITSFNKHTYLLRDFTKDKTLLSNALKFSSGTGGTDFDKAFFGLPAGIYNVAERAQNKPIIVLFTDGEGSADYQVIISKAKNIDAKIYAFISSEEIPLFLSNIAEETGGKTFGVSLTNNDVENAYKYILNEARGVKPCTISWISNTCSRSKNIAISVPTKGILQELTFNISDKYLPGFIYPQSNTLDFGNVTIGSNSSRNIAISANKKDITIDTILVDNNNFSIDLGSQTYPIQINEGSSIPFKILFESNTESYTVAKFNIISDACVNDIFYAIAGGKTAPAADSLLKITFPNGKEKLIAGTDTIITWEGISALDSVAIEYSTDGTNWNMITQFADNLSFKWHIPYDISSTCRVRLRHTNTLLESGDNYIIDAHPKAINKVVWGRNDFDTLYTAGKDGTLKKWYYKYKKESLILTGQINIYDITQNSGSLIASISEDKRVKVYNTNTDNDLIADYGQVSGMNCVDWSKDSRFIVGGSNDGTILIWKLSDKFNPLVSAKLHQSKIVDIQWNPSSSLIASCDAEGFLKISNMTLESGNIVIKEVLTFPQYNYDINAIEWITDEKVAVAANNKEVKIWDINQISLPVSYLRNDIEEYLNDLDYNPVQKILATVGTLHGVRLFNLSQSKTSYQPYFQYDGHQEQVTSVAIRYDGSTVASTDLSGALHVWKIESENDDYKALQDDISDADFSIVGASLSVNDIDFGKQLKDYPADSLISNYFLNSYTFPLTIDSVAIEGKDASLFNLQNSFTNQKLTPGEGLSLLIKSNNTKLGNIEADLIIYYNSLQTKATIKSEVIDKNIDILNDYYYIGKSNIDTSVSRKLTIFYNKSNQNINIKSVNLLQINSDIFDFDTLTEKVIEPNDSLQILVHFEPKEVGRVSSGFEIKTDYFDENITILIAAEGTAPAMLIADTFDFPVLLCDNAISDSITVKNTGNGELVLKDIKFDSMAISSNLSIYASIPPSDSLKIPIVFSSSKVGNITSKMQILTNLRVDNKTILDITINAARDSSGFYLEKNLIEYSNLSEDESGTQIIKVYNSGNMDLKWELPLKSKNFEVTDISPLNTKPGDSSTFTIRFNGGKKSESPYNESIMLSDECGREIPINLMAIIGINDAKIELESIVQFPTLVCQDSGHYQIQIKNVGTTPLSLYSLSFQNIDINYSIEKDYSGTVILPNNSTNIEIKYSSLIMGSFQNTLLLKTNAINIPQGETSVVCKFDKKIVAFTTSETILEIRGLIQDQIGNLTVQIANIGTEDINSLNYSELNRYELIDPPKDLKVGETKELTIKFNGGNLGITYNEELYITDDCKNSTGLKLIAKVDKIPNAKFTVGSISAYPGQTFDLPISLDVEDDINISENDKISFTLVFNKTIMIPKEELISTTDSISRKVNIQNMPMHTLVDGTSIEFRAFLGDTNYTKISIENIEIQSNDELHISTEIGSFNVLGVCIEGGNRFIIDTGKLQLFPNAPNPVYERTTISFFGIEVGRHLISIYDVYGNKLADLFDKYIDPGFYETIFNSDEFPSGSYIYILQTPSTAIKRKLQVIR